MLIRAVGAPVQVPEHVLKCVSLLGELQLLLGLFLQGRSSK